MVNLEKVFSWNPDLILMWHNEKKNPRDIIQDPQWKRIKAVREERVHEFPEVFWCDLWTLKFLYAVKLTAKWVHPELFRDIDLEREKKMMHFFYGKNDRNSTVKRISVIERELRCEALTTCVPFREGRLRCLMIFGCLDLFRKLSLEYTFKDGDLWKEDQHEHRSGFTSCLCPLLLLPSSSVLPIRCPGSTWPSGFGRRAPSGGSEGSADPMVEAILLDVRLPRVILAFLVGASLTVSGNALQALFRNPLVSPEILASPQGRPSAPPWP